ncbi:DUF1543 domain-containing protein [Ferruginibacter sp. HRS2-29]|uniref:DUF1543 domain-containing protein n=1 Tax=Ferruginibacter sp. HRS2-29 TaxID=2487334 RepID=UPI0020CD5142|nr:DUF1543 domain-containing protein [Ferruginibacter sp. HRS2-29]MCP9752389.1 DUF1543 domain-containing protein [Ferruginibacter sp. HRS2-29]
MKLFMLLLGCRVKGRFTEQHDIFFGIAKNLKELIPYMIDHWPEAKGKIHIDAWREVNCANGFLVKVIEKTQDMKLPENEMSLFFINLGGYRAGEFDEFHYKMIIAEKDTRAARRQAMKHVFFKHNTLPKSDLHYKAVAHVDDKYGLDVDDLYNIRDILPLEMKSRYALQLVPTADVIEDPVHLGYLKFTDLSA